MPRRTDPYESTAGSHRATTVLRPPDDPVRDVVDLLSAQIPEHVDEVEDALTWLAFVARARSTDDDTRRAIAEVRQAWLDQCTESAWHLGVPADDHDLEAQRLVLLLESLITAVCDPGMPIDRARAVAMLEHHVRSVHQPEDRGAA